MLYGTSAYAITKMKRILTQNKYIPLLASVLALGAFFRIFKLGNFDFWYDEALNILQARNLGGIFLLQDNNPPLYSAFLHFWERLSGAFYPEFWLRLPSAIFSLVSIYMIFALGKLLFTRRVGLISAFLLAISPFHIHYAQEVRMYSLLVLLNLCAVYFLIRAVRDSRIWLWGGFVCCSILNIYCHYIGVLSWLAQAIFLSINIATTPKEIMKKWIFSNILIFIAFAPWYYFLLKIMGGLENRLLSLNITPWGPPVNAMSLFMTIKNFSIGYNAAAAIYPAAAVIFLFFFIKGFSKLRATKEGILCLLYFIVPILTAYIASPVKHFYLDRFFIGSSVFYLFLVSSGIALLNKRNLFFTLCLIVFFTGPALSKYYRNILPPQLEARQWILKKINHREMVKYICDKAESRDYVFHTCPVTIFPFMYYFQKTGGNNGLLSDKNFLLITHGLGTPVAREFNINFGSANKFDIFGIEERDRFWLVFSYWNFERIKEEYPRAFSILRWIDKNYVVLDKKEFDGAAVFLYQKRS